MRPTPLVLTAMLFASPAYALAPGERALSFEGTGGTSLYPVRRVGLGGGLSFAQGITDTVALRLAAESVWHPTSASRDGFVDSHLIVGATFAFDALAYVPFADLAATVSDQRTNNAASQWVGIQVGLGMDYLFSRSIGLGLVMRSTVPMLRLAGAEGMGQNIPLLLALRITRYF